jgi:hypothetical protein
MAIFLIFTQPLVIEKWNVIVKAISGAIARPWVGGRAVHVLSRRLYATGAGAPLISLSLLNDEQTCNRRDGNEFLWVMA